MAGKNAENSRKRILAAATVCFANYGYEGASIADIAKYAGFAKSTVLYYYESKLAILSELIRPLLKAMEEAAASIRGCTKDEARLIAIEKMADQAVTYRSVISLVDGELPKMLHPGLSAEASKASDALLMALAGGRSEPEAMLLAHTVVSGIASTCHHNPHATDTQLRVVALSAYQQLPEMVEIALQKKASSAQRENLR